LDHTTRRSYHHFTEHERRLIKQWYPLKSNEWIALELGLKVKQISGFAERNASERWARKSDDALTATRSDAGKKGGRPRRAREGK